ncbi:MAG: uroporphyrinogen decarboxylase family protein [Rikenellaceae bacterium]
MRGKELIKKAFDCQSVERVPWVPFVGVHAGALVGVDAESYLRSPELMFEGLSRAIELYNPDGIPVSFDLQMEAEILGCDLVWSRDNPPSVASHPMGEGGTKSLSDMFIPKESDGRIGITMELTRRLRAKYPDLALYGLITGPFTLALHLCGTDIFMKMFTDEAEVLEIMAFCTEVCKAMSGYYVAAGCDIVAVVDPMCSQIGPDQFEQFVLKSCSDLFAHIKKIGAYSSFFVCGHAQHNIEVMCQSKPNNISIDENIPLDYVRDVCLKHNISYGGNLKLTAVLLMGEVEDARRDVVECLDIASHAENRGFILAPGCDLAYATPIQNLVACGELVGDLYQQEIVRAMGPKISNVEPLDLSSYVTSDVVKVDCITLDSLGCAACQYMWEATQRGAEPFGSKVKVVEHSIKSREGIEFMAAAGVKNIPTIMIDGKIVFVSNIPPVADISKAIEQVIVQKLL